MIKTIVVALVLRFLPEDVRLAAKELMVSGSLLFDL